MLELTSKVGDIGLHVMNVIFQSTHQSSHVAGPSMYVPNAMPCITFNPSNDIFKVMELCVELAKISIKMRDTSPIVGDFVDVIGKCLNLSKVMHQMWVLRRMSIMSRFMTHQIRLTDDIKRQSIKVSVYISTRLLSKSCDCNKREYCGRNSFELDHWEAFNACVYKFGPNWSVVFHYHQLTVAHPMPLPEKLGKPGKNQALCGLDGFVSINYVVIVWSLLCSL